MLVSGPLSERLAIEDGRTSRHPVIVAALIHSRPDADEPVAPACGEDPNSVMAQLGHTDPTFTLQVYTHMMGRAPGERARLKADAGRGDGRG